MKRMAYFPGCTLKSKAKDLDLSLRAVFEELSIELVELPRWNCCGAVFSLTSDDLLRQVAPITDLIRVRQMEDDGLVDDSNLVAPCAMCFNVLKRANLRVKNNPEDLKKINDHLYLEDRPYDGKAEIIHPLQILAELSDQIVEKAKFPLQGLKVSPYYGCTLLRPKEVAFEDPEAPYIQEKILSDLGAEVVQNPNRTRCCGSYQTINDLNLVLGLVSDIIKGAALNGAQVITTFCPLCSFNLDYRQKELLNADPHFPTLPILYFPQLLALTFGKKFFQDEHFVDPQPYLENFLNRIERGDCHGAE